jgi:hypothetical protein
LFEPRALRPSPQNVDRVARRGGEGLALDRVRTLALPFRATLAKSFGLTCRFAFSAPPFYAKYDIPLLITKTGEFYSNTCDAPVWGARPPRLVSLIAIENNHLFKPMWSEHGPAPSSSFLKRLRRFVFRRLSANCRIQDAVGLRFVHFENACR